MVSDRDFSIVWYVVCPTEKNLLGRPQAVVIKNTRLSLKKPSCKRSPVCDRHLRELLRMPGVVFDSLEKSRSFPFRRIDNRDFYDKRVPRDEGSRTRRA